MAVGVGSGTRAVTLVLRWNPHVYKKARSRLFAKPTLLDIKLTVEKRLAPEISSVRCAGNNRLQAAAVPPVKLFASLKRASDHL